MSKLFSLKERDFIKGAVMAFLMSLLTGLYQLIQDNSALNWATIKPVLLVCVGSFLGYLIKNFFTNSKDDILKKEVK